MIVTAIWLVKRWCCRDVRKSLDRCWADVFPIWFQSGFKGVNWEYLPEKGL
jgi:hypothetical protein